MPPQGPTVIIGRSSMPADLVERGNCTSPTVDPELFFPQTGGTADPALLVCYACEVRRICLEYALSVPLLSGVWGGYTERERRSERARRDGGEDQ